MNRLIRPALGLSVVALLVPVLVTVTSGESGRGVEDQESEALALASEHEGHTIGEEPSNDLDTVGESPTTTNATSLVDFPDPLDNSQTTSGGVTSTAAQNSTSPTSANTSTSTPGGHGEHSSGDITGSACPCMITGTATIKGTVSLRGDLMVDGGTLIARPGVTVEGNGFQIMFMNGGRADFQGTPVFTWSGAGSNANLKRDITFKNLRRIMFHSGAGRSVLKYFSVVDSGTAGVLGDYPVHFHLNGNSTRGTLVEGVVVLNGRNHAFVPHGSHGITFKDTIAKNIRDTAYWWDPPGTNNCSSRRQFCTTDNSNDTIYDHVLADGVSLPHGAPGYHRVAAFQLGAGSGNVVRNSVAINISGGADCAGFHWPESANQNKGGNVWTFRNNYSRSPSGCHGLFVWQNDFNNHVINGFSGGGVDHGAYLNTYHYRDLDVTYLEVHALGWSVSDSSLGDVSVHRHILASDTPVTFTNVSMKSFVIDNRNSTEEKPGTYVLNGTNIACLDVVFKSVVPGSKVFIDGVECLPG